MTRREWLACADPGAMLRLVRDRGLLSPRKARLFGAACCRRVWDVLPEEGRRVVETIERHADALAGRQELDAARRAVPAGFAEVPRPVLGTRFAVSCLLAETAADPTGYALYFTPWASCAAGEQAARAGIVRCLFGPPPFRQVKLHPGALPGDVSALARAAYDCRGPGGLLDPDRLAVLADALEEAGADEAFLAHLRGPAPHARGCWPVDLLLGKQ